MTRAWPYTQLLAFGVPPLWRSRSLRRRAVAATGESGGWLADLLRDNEVRFHLPEEFVIIFSHQGYQAAWFELPATEPDPPAWSFCEGTTNEVVKIASVTSFFEEQFRALIPAVKSLHSR